MYETRAVLFLGDHKSGNSFGAGFKLAERPISIRLFFPGCNMQFHTQAQMFLYDPLS